MDRFVNAFFRIRGSSNTTNSQNMPRTYVAEDMDKRVDTSMVWSMTVVNNPIWSFGFHFCDEEINITPSLLNPPHKHVHSSGDECLSTLKICPLEKVTTKNHSKKSQKNHKKSQKLFKII